MVEAADLSVSGHDISLVDAYETLINVPGCPTSIVIAACAIPAPAIMLHKKLAGLCENFILSVVFL